MRFCSGHRVSSAHGNSWTTTSVVEMTFRCVECLRLVFYPDETAGLASKKQTGRQLRNDGEAGLVAHRTVAVATVSTSAIGFPGGMALVLTDATAIVLCATKPAVTVVAEFSTSVFFRCETCGFSGWNRSRKHSTYRKRGGRLKLLAKDSLSVEDPMPHYRIATAAPVHLKIMVSFLLSILVAVTVGLALRSALRVDTVIDKHIARYRTQRP